MKQSPRPMLLLQGRFRKGHLDYQGNAGVLQLYKFVAMSQIQMQLESFQSMCACLHSTDHINSY